MNRVAMAWVITIATALAAPSTVPSTAAAPRFSAVAFDYLVVFNPDSVISAVDLVVPGKGRAFTDLWRARQFAYCWLRSMTDQYVDFAAVTADALTYTANAMGITLRASQRRMLLDAYSHLTPWPDTAMSLRRLRASGVRVITIANFSPPMLRSNAAQAGLMPLFDALVSTDANHSYKPDPRAYQLGVDRLALPKDQIVFAAFAGWDAAGAKAFGYPTVWVNRSRQAPEELGVRPDRVVGDLRGLVDFVLGTPPVER